MKRNAKNFRNFVFFCAMVLFVVPSWAKTNYRFATIAGSADHFVRTKMLSNIFKDAGLVLEVEPMPAERAKSEAISGNVDGDLGRIASYGEQNPTLVRVPTPYSTSDVATFGLKSKNISINSIEDLKNYKIVIVRGIQATKDIVAKLPDLQVYEIGNTDQMMKFLEHGRADVGIISRFAGIISLKQQRIDTVTMTGLIYSLPLYLYFHTNNKDIVPIVDAAISAKTKTGEMQKLREQCEKEYLDAIK